MLAYEVDKAIEIPNEAFDDERSALLFVHGIHQDGNWQFRAWAVSDRHPDISIPVGGMHTKGDGEPNRAINSAVAWASDACDAYELRPMVIDTYASADATMVVIGVAGSELTWKHERVDGVAQEACEQALVDFPR